MVIKNFLALNNTYSGLSTAKLNITKAEAMNVTIECNNYHELSCFNLLRIFANTFNDK